MKSEDKVMGEGLSLHLDIVRVSAALVVVIGHSFGKDISGGWIKIPVVGPDAVMVFFVLSGFVIAFTVEKKDATIGHYICSRLARLWSVLVPALALTIILDYLGMYLFPVFYHNWGTIEQVSCWNYPVLRILAALTFSNELWFTTTRPMSDIPVWSLGFEFWYYAIFGAWYYLQNGSRWILLALCLLICGPKIILLMPVWIVGVLAYKWLCTNRFSEPWGWVAFFAPIAAHFMIKALRPYEHTTSWIKRLVGDQGFDWLGSAHWFPYSYLIGLLVAVHFAGAGSVQKTLSLWLSPFRAVIKNVSHHTLSIYLFHYPILLFVAATLSLLHPGPIRTSLSILITLTACFALGSIFENTRFAWRSWLESIPLLTRLSQRPVPLPGHPAAKAVEL